LSASVERIRSDIESIARFSSSSPGMGRLTFSDQYWAALDYVAGRLAEVGYERLTTVHGNTRFRRRGVGWDEPAVTVGSHLDAVPDGGRFDGVAGVVAGVEIARLLAEDGHAGGRPYEVIVFAEEEGARFGSVLLGSKALIGKLSSEALAEVRDADGVSYLEALAPMSRGALAGRGDVLRPGDIVAHFELHIEQSLVLESAHVPVGIVQAITGIHQYVVCFTGTANHAGATPMRLRADALAGVAEAILAVEEIATASGGTTVGTVGMLTNEPNAANVIPGRTVFSVDLRDIDADALARVDADVLRRIRQIADRRQLRCELLDAAASDAVVLSERLRRSLIEAAARLGIDCLEMPSGAAHDTQEIARIADAAMVFVPSIGGRSHCPEEDTPYETIALATDVVFQTVARECGVGA
jgi:hydantoinase/carbamoylase family amidase